MKRPILCLVFLVLSSSFCIASTEQDLGRIREELKVEKIRLREVKERESKALNNLYKVNRELKDAKEDLSQTKVRIVAGGKKIKVLSSELKGLEAELKDRSKHLSKRIGEAFKCGSGLSFLDVLLSSTSISDFVNKQYYFERMISSDLSLINEVKGQAKAIEETKSELRGAIAEMHLEARNIVKRKGQIESQAETKRRLYESLKDRRQEYERRVAELEKSSRQFEGLIRRAADDGGGKPRGTGKMIWPASGRIISGFGYRRHPLWGGTHLHAGVDLAAAYGEPVRAADGGSVIFSGWWDGYGKAVVIDHGRLTSTVYGHMSRIYVEAGQRIDKSQIIGLVGSTGFSTGPHLHFEVRRNGAPVNPMPYLL